MAILFVENLSQKIRVVQIAVKTLEVVLLSVGIISILLMLKGAVLPYSCEFVFSSLVGFWKSIRCFLSSPLYIGIIIYAIILLITILSSFHRPETNYQDHDSFGFDAKTIESAPTPSPPPSAPRDVTGVVPPPSTPRGVTRAAISQPSTPRGVTRAAVSQPSTPRGVTRDTVFQPSTPRGVTRTTVSQPSTPRGVNRDVLPPLMMNRDAADVAVASPPPTRKRFPKSSATKTLYRGSLDEFLDILHDNKEQKHFEQANQFSSDASSSRGKFMPKANEIKKTTYSVNSSDSLESMKVKRGPKYPLSVSIEHEEEDTMEATWRAIMGGGKQRQQKKQLKKSETWDVPPRTSNFSMQRLDSEEVFPSSPTWKELRKSETFNDAMSMTRRGGLRRDRSMSLEDFNKRVEDFIKKGKDFMRLQKQESSK